jgi:hypothetical protein
VIETLLFDDEATVLADIFFDVRSDVTVALGTLVGARVRLDILIEARFVDVSGCHHAYCVQELASTASPSPIVGSIKMVVQLTRDGLRLEIAALSLPSCVFNPTRVV